MRAPAPQHPRRHLAERGTARYAAPAMSLISTADAIHRRPWAAYGLALLLCLATAWIRIGDHMPLGRYPLLLVTGAVTLATFFGGLGPGIMTALLLATVNRFFALAPPPVPVPSPATSPTAMFFLLTVSGVIIGLMHGLFAAHAAQMRSDGALRELNAELETRVAARTASLETEMAQRSEAEAQLRQMQKMESIGQLTGGIAHDFNNMLAIVIGSLDMARRRMTGDANPAIGRCIDSAAEGARRAAVLTARLLAFSRRQPLSPQVLDANRLVGGMSELLRHTIGEHIVIETVLADGLWHAFADAGQLESAILNLAVNARDAMPGGGRLTIETANAVLDERDTDGLEAVEPGDYVLIDLTDTGTGMPPEVIERAFDPFYTTKEVGKGTGLGLSQVYGYVRQSGGHVRLRSEAGQGASVRIYLPRHRGDGLPVAAPHADDAAPPGDPGRIVLVVEDEAAVRDMTVDALRALGYTVLHASDGRQALARLAAQPRIDLLLTDVVMPEMNGRQLAERVRALRPEVRVLFTTGYTRDAVAPEAGPDGAAALLPKPFTIAQLAAKVRDSLGGEAG